MLRAAVLALMVDTRVGVLVDEDACQPVPATRLDSPGEATGAGLTLSVGARTAEANAG